MCLGSEPDVEVDVPEPPPLPPPIPAPAPPKVQEPRKQDLTDPGEAVDIRIGGAAKKDRRGSASNPDTSATSTSLTISDNQGLNI